MSDSPEIYEVIELRQQLAAMTHDFKQVSDYVPEELRRLYRAALAVAQAQRDDAETERIEWVKRGERAESLLAERDERIQWLEDDASEAQAQWTKTNAQYESAAKAVTRLTGALAERDARIAELEGQIELCRSMNAQLRQAPHQLRGD